MNETARHPIREHLPHLATRELANRAVIQYVTVCVANRRPLLARPEIASLLLRVWGEASRWHVGRYVLMPDHLHLFCAPAVIPPTPLKDWIACWRACSSRWWPHYSEKPVWQRDFFDRQLRSGENYGEKWSYVRENPVRAGLVTRSEDWPFQGEVHVLPWHDAV